MRLVALVVVALGAVCDSAHAQSAMTVGWPAPGSHIRLESSGGHTRQYGTFATVRNDSIVFIPEDFDFQVALPTTAVAKMDVARGSDRHVWAGIGLGFVIAGCTAALATAATWKDPGGDFDFGRWGDAAIVGVPAGVLGAVIGGVIGAIPMDKWLRVPIPRG